MSAAEGGVWRDASVDDGGGLPHARPAPKRAPKRARVQPNGPRQHAAPEAFPLASQRQRPRTESVRRVSKRRLAAEAAEYPDAEFAHIPRPVTRGDCLPGGSNAERPCPYAGCKHHLYMEVNDRNGNIKTNFPGVEVWEMRETCALDVADRDGETLLDVGRLLNLTRERVRQLQDVALFDLAGGPLTQALADVEHIDSRGEIAASDDGSGARSDREALSELWSARTAGVSLW